LNREFAGKLAQLNLPHDDGILEKFDRYYRFLMQENQVMNLTAITSEPEVYVKHFLDSLSLTKAVELNTQTLLDVGSGAGFPSLPLKIVFPGIKVTIVDSLGKRIRFMEKLLEVLETGSIELVNQRIEDLETKNHFDIVTARAVARMNILVELCLPFVKPGGVFVAMKTYGSDAEIEEAAKAISLLGGKIEKKIDYVLDGDNHHVLIVIRKTRMTDSMYPRSYAKIKKKPL